MVEVNGQTLIDRVLQQLSKLNLTRLVLVVGYKSQELKNYIGNRYEDALKIEYIENPIYDKTNNIYSLALAKDALCEDDTLLLESDLIFEDSILEMLVQNPNPNLALVAKYQSWMDGTMVRIDSDCNIVNFVPKAAFRYEDVDVYYKTVNIYKFSKKFAKKEYVPFLDAYSKVMGNNEYYEQVLRVITMVHNSSLKALDIEDRKWYEIDDIQDLDIASAIFSQHDVKYGEYHKRYGGYWRFPNLLDYCYLVNPFFPPKKMLDEMKANFETLLREYPSGQWVNSLLAALLSQPGGGAWLIADSRTAELSPALQDYIKRGYVLQGDTPGELAQATGLPEEALKAALEQWNDAVSAGEDGEFGRSLPAVPLDTAPFYAVSVTPGILYTTGGIRIDSAAQVLDAQGNAIPGLFAAGEATGGIHGAGIPDGNALTDAVVFGRIAGESAAAFAG